MFLLSSIKYMTLSPPLFCEFLCEGHSYVLIIFVTTMIFGKALSTFVHVGRKSREWMISAPLICPPQEAELSCEYLEPPIPILMVISSLRKWNHKKLSVCSLRAQLEFPVRYFLTNHFFLARLD